ncbi:RNA polymerase sigma factor [Polaribacter sp. AHE13PA]|uniref:RNA polymerase sigma factor n=1 Tax=Polaribacter sp. AHE13PA TaxID=2745562 RepID=UPI001C4E8E53|nr:RNA polymerase sigma-70 factor [Polaribacter sp. AHE13PA]QXP66413.1 RNA polymerase sigma-70 factor [Polaribacter sp. AHE13PA]
MKTLSDDTILAKSIKKGSRKAFSVLFDRYYKKLLDYAVTYTHDLHEAEDIVQQTFITLWNNRLKINTEKSIKSYLYRITHNTYIDIYRKQKKSDSFFNELKEQVLRERITEDPEILEKRITKLKNTIEILPEQCKKVLYLNKFENLKYKEISEQLDISIKTVESHMYTAYKKIRKAFEEDNLFLFFAYKFAYKQ